MKRSTLEWYEQMARGLVWAGAVVLALAIVGAVIVAGSDNAIGIAPEAEQQGRGVLALASLGIGLTSAGLLAGLGAILRMLVTERLEQLGPAPERPEAPASAGGREPKRDAAPARGRPRRDAGEPDPGPGDG